MAEQGGDAGARLFASGQLSQNKGGGDDATNSEDALQAMVKSGGKAVYNMAKLTAIPINLSGLGETSITQPLDSEGVSGKMIASMFSSADSKGGMIAKLLHDIFVKNREITDHTTGVGGSASGDGGGGGGGGGGDAGGGGGNWGSGAAMANFDGGDMVAVTVSALPTGGSRFDWGEASQPMGGFTPSATPSMGVSSGAGMDMS